jgi:hypothetical protein
MSKIRSMPKFGWFVIGVAVAVLLMPSSVALARSALKVTGIKGVSGSTADVTPAGQLLTTEAQPSNLLGGSSSDQATFEETTSLNAQDLFAAPSNDAVAMNGLSLDVVQGLSSASPGNIYALFIGNSSACSNTVGNWEMNVNPTGLGLTEVSLTPGVAIPASDYLCAIGSAASGDYTVSLTATGSLVPSTNVSNETLHALPDLKLANG